MWRVGVQRGGALGGRWRLKNPSPPKNKKGLLEKPCLYVELGLKEKKRFAPEKGESEVKSTKRVEFFFWKAASSPPPFEQKR